MFIPSLLVLVLAAIVCFVLLPKMSVYTLGLLSVGLFILGVWQHYQMFPYEYRASLFADLLRDYSPFVMLAAVILSGTVYMMLAYGGNPPSVAEVLPAVANVIPGMNAHVANNVVKSNNMGAASNNAAKSNNAGILGGLANMVNMGAKPNNSGANNAAKAANNAAKAANNAAKAANNNAKRANLASTSFRTV